MVEQARGENPDGELVLGSFDADGRLLGQFGELPGLPKIDSNLFVQRKRYDLKIVLIGDQVLVRKDFQGERSGFVGEWYSHSLVYGYANVPAIYRVDEDRCIVYKNLIPGKTIRSILVEAGAKILGTQTKDDPDLAHLDEAARIRTVWARGRALISTCFSESFLVELEHQLQKIHAQGVTGVSVTFGNIIVDADRRPWLIDFDKAHVDKPGSWIWVCRKNDDTIKFNRIYGRNLPVPSLWWMGLGNKIANYLE
jgi:hypothetical protein